MSIEFILSWLEVALCLMFDVALQTRDLNFCSVLVFVFILDFVLTYVLFLREGLCLAALLSVIHPYPSALLM